MQVFQGLPLRVLCLAQLLNQVLLDALQLTHFVLHCMDRGLAPLLSFLVLPTDELLLLLLAQALILQELALIVLDLLRLLPFPLSISRLIF